MPFWTRPVSDVRVSPDSSRPLPSQIPLDLSSPTPNVAYLAYVACVTHRLDLLTARRVRDPRAPAIAPFC
jgi:hypothetical protein